MMIFIVRKHLMMIIVAVSEMVNCLALYFLRQQMNYETLL